MVELAALLIGTAITALIAIIVFEKNNRSVTNKFFIGLSVGLVGWSITTYFSLHANNDAQTLMWIRWIMFFVVIQTTCFMFLVKVFPAHEYNIFKSKKYILAATYSLLTAFTALSPFLFVDFKDGSPVPGIGMALFLPHALIFALGGAIGLLVRFKRATGSEKAQLQYFLAGTGLLFTLLPLSNFVFPVFFKNNQFVIFSPIYTMIFSGFIAYAIIAQKLFNIKTVVARAVAYILSTFFVAIMYVVIVLLLLSIAFSDFKITSEQFVVFAIIGVALVIAYPILKQYFDKVSKKVFYRDAYDAQALIDELNRSLVTNVELDSLLTKSALIIQENLKASFCTFYVRETSYFPDRIIGAHRGNPEFNNIELIEQGISKLRTKVFSSEIEPQNENDAKLRDLIKDNDIEIVARLVDTLDYEVKGIGYIFLGSKRSGSSYSSQDMKILEIIANELVIAVENVLRFEEIEEFNVTLQKKIDTATRELKQTNEKLKALDEAKDEFVSMASHQLRTPLTSIKGYISMVMEGDAGKINENQEKMLGQAFFSSQRMVYLISDLLNVSRLKTGKFLIESKPVYLPDIVESELNQLQEGAKVKDITMSFSKPKRFATLNLDEMKIRQVIMNFADNALHYTPAGGKINVELKETPKSVELTVKDTGIGVPKEQRPKLFTKFYRADNARKARPDGTGLGLFMAKKVVIAQGGSVIFDSKEGKGSTFGFSFPKEKLEVEVSAKGSPE